MRAYFRRGRHHLHASLLARPFDERPRATVSTLVERIQGESALGSVAIEIRCDVEEMSSKLRAALDQHRAQHRPPAVEIGAPA